MPIRPEFRKFYGREWRTVTRPRILARAGNKCEQCGVLDRLTVTREGGGWWDGTYWFHPTGVAPWGWNGRTRLVQVVLTVAHLNHVAGDDRDDNLKALCQWCHLNYDKLHHKEIRQTRKDARRPLLVAAASAPLQMFVTE